MFWVRTEAFCGIVFTKSFKVEVCSVDSKLIGGYHRNPCLPNCADKGDKGLMLIVNSTETMTTVLSMDILAACSRRLKPISAATKMKGRTYNG